MKLGVEIPATSCASTLVFTFRTQQLKEIAMNMQKNHTARKATALLSAIAASSLLGLPALAGGSVGDANKGREQAQSYPNQMQCAPTTQSNLPSTTAAPDASAPAAAQLPNQSDPRAGLSPSDQTQTANRKPVESSTSASSVQMNKPSNTSSQNTSFNNVLAQGGVTAGGFASRQVSAANNPEAYRMVNSRYGSNQERPNNYKSDAGMTGNMGSTMSANESMRSDAMNQPSSQSSRMTGTTIAQCPGVMMMPQSTTTPDMRQTPSQPNAGNRINNQQTLPQQ